MSAILTLNAGSSSVKFSVYLTGDGLVELAVGQVDNVGGDARLVRTHNNQKHVEDLGATDHSQAVEAILKAIMPLLDGRRIDGVGHRIVHGGVNYSEPIILSKSVQTDLRSLVELVPLHQSFNLLGVTAAQEAFPDILQVGCFDTAFHRSQSRVSDTFALPRRFYDEGVRRYGFHGLSYQYISQVLRRDYPELAAGRVVIAHLGNGASMCAMRDGLSVGSSMGFSTLDGLAMGTRCGQLDAGVVLYLLQKGMTESEISQLLYNESGLKGLSGISHDMRTLLASEAPEAEEAIDYYVYRIRRELGAMTAMLGGLDGFVFCGGIGEHAAEIRARVLDGMEYFGLVLDESGNRKNGPRIGKDSVEVLVIPTDEERVIAEATVSLLGAQTETPSSEQSHHLMEL
ncbi:MAG: acetate/propionate family kinase [Pseudomonadota bacterium]